MHLDLNDPVPGACLTSSALFIKAEPTFIVSAASCVLCHGKQISDLIKYTRVSRRI